MDNKLSKLLTVSAIIAIVVFAITIILTPVNDEVEDKKQLPTLNCNNTITNKWIEGGEFNAIVDHTNLIEYYFYINNNYTMMIDVNTYHNFSIGDCYEI